MSRLSYIFLFLATSLWASPLLEKAAGTIENRSLRIELEWIHTPAAGMGKPTRSKGVLRLASGNRFVLRSQSLTLASDGTTLWQYMPAAKQVLIQKLSNIDPSQLPVGLLRNALHAHEVSVQKEVHDGVPAQRIELKADKAPLSRYQSVQLWIRAASHEPLELNVRDDQGAGIAWKLRRIQDFEPDAKTFVFNVPAGVNIVDTRK